MPKYETYSKVKAVYGVSPETVKNWAKRGQIGFKCVQNATRKTWLYDLESVGAMLQRTADEAKREEEARGNKNNRIIYIRVSSAKQRADLDRQRELLSNAFPDTEIIEDVGSGINFHRHGFATLVRRICRDEISQVVVTFKDRIARIGYELFELLCKEHGCSILVYCDSNTDKPDDDESDLKDDLLSIITVFVASNNGKRAALLKKERKKAAAGWDGQNQIIPDERTENEIEHDAGCKSLGLE